MVTDLDLNQDKDIHLDAANDLATTSGFEQLQQSVAIDVMDELQDFFAAKVTGQTIGFLEERIQRALNDDPQVNQIRSVTVEEFNRQTNTVTVDINVIGDDDFTLTLPE